VVGLNNIPRNLPVTLAKNIDGAEEQEPSHTDPLGSQLQLMGNFKIIFGDLRMVHPQAGHVHNRLNGVHQSVALFSPT